MPPDPKPQAQPRAVALRYDRSAASPGAAPEVVAKGRGEVATRILDLAREHDVPVREDADLVELLSHCQMGDEIPVDVYGAVAQLLTWLYRLDGDA